MNGLLKKLFLLTLIVLLVSCSDTGKTPATDSPNGNFSTEMLTVPDAGGNKVRGQVLYLPVYSNIPCLDQKMFSLSAFIAIHNTDLNKTITVTKVFYFNNDGVLVKDFLKSPQTLAPLATTHFFVPESDQSGTGANFIVEWTANAAVTEPLVESVMVSCRTNYGISFSSRGKVIREMR